MSRRKQIASDDERLAAEWLSVNLFELNVMFMPNQQQWLVGVYIVGERELHGDNAQLRGAGMAATLGAAMRQAIVDVEQSR